MIIEKGILAGIFVLLRIHDNAEISMDILLWQLFICMSI
jgi:hypothetical protein